MTGLGNVLYVLMIFAGIGAVSLIGGGIWFLWWAFTHVSVSIA